MEGTVPTEATGDKNGRGVELANQTGVGKPSSKVLGPRRCDLGTIIDKDGKTYKVRKMIALLLLLKHPGLPWKNGGEAAHAIFSSGRHCINRHYKYWKEKMSENYDGIVLVGEFFFSLLQSCGYLDGGLASQQEIDLVNALPLPDEFF